MVVSFIDGENRNNLEKTTHLRQITDKLYHNVVSSKPRHSGIRTQHLW
jgi:hypothetical protein